MKTFIFSFLLIALAGAESNTKSRLAGKALETLLENGLKRKIGVFADSLILSDASGRFEFEENSLSFETRAVFAHHLDSMEVLAVKPDLQRNQVNIHLRVPSITLQGDYIVKEKQGVSGKGFFEVVGHEIVYEAKALFNKQAGTFRVAGVSVKNTKKAIASYFEKLASANGELKSDLMKAIFSEYSNQINLQLAKALKTSIGDLLQSFDATGRAEIGNANAYIDEVLILVREKIISEGLDRIPLTNISIGFSQDVWLIGNVHGECGLYEGVLGGFETLHRIKDDATFDFNSPAITVNASVGINNGLLGYTISITFMDIGPQATLTGVLSYANIFFEAQILLDPLTVSITKFDIQDIGHIDIQIEGLEPFNWLADIIVGTVVNTVKGIIKEIIEGPIRRIMEWAINEYVKAILNPPSAVAAQALRLAL